MRTAALSAGFYGRSHPRSLPGPFDAAGGRPPVDFGPDRRLQIDVFFGLGADLSANPSTWIWTKIPGNLIRYDGGNGITVNTGRSDASSRVSPGSATLMVDNRDGRFTRKNAMGPYYPHLTRNTPILIQVNAGNGAYNLVEMFVNEFPNRWDKTGTDFWMPLRCGGVLRRLNRGTSPSRSQLRRGREAGTVARGGPPLAYWPMEDESGAVNFPSPMPDIGPMVFTQDTVAPGTAVMTDLGGSEPLPILTTGAQLTGVVDMPASNTSWSVEFVTKIQYTAASTVELLRWETPGGTPWIWRLSLVNSSPIALKLDGLDSDGTALPAFSLSRAFYDLNLVDATDRWVMIEVSARQSGGNVIYSFVYSFGENTTALGSGEATDVGTMKGIKAVKLGAVTGLPSALSGTALGHWVVRDQEWGYFQLNDDELMGVRAETAVTRLTRVCREQGVPITFAPGVVDSVQMGRQTAASFIDVLRECEEADGGTLYEYGFGLYYQPIAARYNRPVDLYLDFSRGDISGEPQPIDDDQGFCNSFTVTRTGAESITVADSDSVDDVGLYEDSTTVNTFDLGLAEQVGNWRLHAGQDDNQRWPRLDLRLDNAAGRALIPNWELLPPGARVQITNPPSVVSRSTVDVYLEGKQEKVNQFTWEIQFNASAAAPYRVFVLDDPVLGKLDTDGSTLSAGSYSAKSEGASSTKDYILVADFAAAAFNIGDKAQLFGETGELKEATIFTVTSKPSGFGFTEIHFTPTAADYTYGLYLGTGETIRHASETTFLVATTTATSPLWTTTATEFPFNILVGGELMTVTGISGASSPQTFTVVRSVNGVVKSHTAGTDVVGDFAVLAR